MAATPRRSLPSLAAWFAFWFAATILFNGAAVRLVDASKAAGLDPEDVTLLEMLTCGVLGLLVESRRGFHGLLPLPGYRKAMLAICAANLATCRLFIVAMQRIPLSLLQTIRACQPLFAVTSLRLLAGKRYSSTIYACVATSARMEFEPIVPRPVQPSSVGCRGPAIRTLMRLRFPFLTTVSVGFAASASGDRHFEGLGFAAGCLSVMLLVFVNLRTKQLLEAAALPSPAGSAQASPDAAQVQGWTTLGSFALLLPMWIARGGVPRLVAAFTHAALGRPLALALAADGFSYYLANIGTFRSITMLDSLSFSVLDTVRRLCVVASGFVLQGNPCSTVNVAGIALVFAGAGAYARTTASEAAASAKKD